MGEKSTLSERGMGGRGKRVVVGARSGGGRGKRHHDTAISGFFLLWASVRPGSRAQLFWKRKKSQARPVSLQSVGMGDVAPSNTCREAKINSTPDERKRRGRTRSGGRSKRWRRAHLSDLEYHSQREFGLSDPLYT